jgi:hypothetical protein
MTRPINGVIVAYDAGQGVLLLQRASIASVEELAKRYARSKEDRGFWFARFAWSDIAESDRELLQQDGKSIRKTLLGRRVICTVAKDPKWRALWVSVDLDRGKLSLPERRAHPERYLVASAGGRKGESQLQRRRAAPRSNNLRRPWGGMGQ